MLQFLGRFEILAGLGLALICAAVILWIRRRSRSSVPSEGTEPKPAVKQKTEQTDIQFFPAIRSETTPQRETLDEAADEDQDEETPEDYSTPKPRNIVGSTHGWQTVESSFKTTPRIPEKIPISFKSKKKSWKYRSVFIIWLDPSKIDLNPWMYLDEADTLFPAKVASIGWIIHEADEYLVLASSIGTNEVCLSPVVILKAAILHMEEIPLGYTPDSS